MRHPDDEDLLKTASAADPDVDEAGATRHLGSCLRCQRRLRDLRSVRHTLGTLGTPVVPDTLAADIAARVGDSPEEDRRSSMAAEDQHPNRLQRRLASLGPRHLAIAATVAVAAGGISVAVTGGGSAASSTLPSLRASEEVGAATTEPAEQTLAPSLPGRDTGNRVEVAAADSTAGTVLSVTANDYGHTTLGDGVNALFRTSPVPPADTSAGTGSATAFDTSALPTGTCLRAVGRLIDHSPATTWALVGVELARYDGRPATVLAFVARDTDAAQVAIAVDGTCSAGDPLVLDQVSVGS